MKAKGGIPLKLIDVYLGRHGKKRYDVFKETGLSQQTLASANGKPAAALTGRILQAIGRTVGETPGRVLDEMLMIEQEGLVMTVTTKVELLEALKRAADRIDVEGGLRTEVLRLAKKNFMASYTGVTPGSIYMMEPGTPYVQIVENAIKRAVWFFMGVDEEEKANLEISERMRLYNLHVEELPDGHTGIRLVQRQLEYLDGKGNL